MAEEAAIDLTIKTGDAEKNTQSVKARIKEIKAALLDLDEGSDEFKKLSQEAGQLTDKISDVNKRINNLASDTKKLDAVVGVAQGIAGGFAAAQGAIALFGQENEDLNKTMIKVQGSIALLNGVQQISILLQKESAVMVQLNATATAAWNVVIGTTNGLMKALRIAIAATGIGALVVGLGLLVANFDSVSKSIKDTVNRFDFLKLTVEKLGQAWRFVTDKLRDFFSMFGLMDSAVEHHAAVLNEAAIKDLERVVKAKEEEIAVRKALGQKTYDLEQELFDARIDLAKAKGEDETAILIEQMTAIRAERQKNAELEAKAEEERLAERVKVLREENAEKQRILTTMQEAEAKMLQDDLDLKKSYDEQDIERRKALAELVTEIRAADVEEAKLTQAQIDDAKKKSIDDSFMLTAQSLKATQGLSDVFYQNQLNQAAGNDKKTREIKKKQFETNKLFTVSSIVLDTVMGMIKAIAQNPPPSPVGIASSIALGIAGTAATIKALATKFEGGGGGTIAPPSANAGADVNSPSPTANNIPNIPQTPQSIPIPQQVYVTETDISGVQGQVQVIEGLSKVG